MAELQWSGLFMNTPRPYILLSLALLAGCSPSPETERLNGSGYFTLTNSPGTVFWANLEDSATNDIQFVLLLPEADEIGCAGGGGPEGGDTTYDYWSLKTRRDGHQWEIEASGTMKTGTESLRLSDLTANTVTNINLSRSRTWRISDDWTLTPLDKIDPTITERVLHQSESQFKQSQSFRNGISL